MSLVADLRVIRLPLVAPLVTANGSIHERVGVVLALSDGEHTGWGEAMPMPGWSEESLDDVETSLAAAAAGLAAVDGLDDPRLGEMLDELEQQPHARAAVAGAVLDLSARRAGCPAATLLDHDAPLEVAVNGLVAHSDPDDVAVAVQRLSEAGITAVKVKVAAAPLEVDLARVAAARAAGGPGLEIRLDANGGWDAADALAALEALSRHGVAFCEEPVPGLAAIAEVGAVSPVPVAVDESARSVDDIAVALGSGVIDVVVVKPQAIGGPDLALRAVWLASDAGASAVVTTMIDSAIGVAHAAHVAAASGSPLAHGLHTSPLLATDLAPALPILGGRLQLRDRPGIGVVPRFAALPREP